MNQEESKNNCQNLQSNTGQAKMNDFSSVFRKGIAEKENINKITSIEELETP